MIELFEMAKLVDNDIVQIFFRQMDDPIVEIEIALLTATPPAGFLIADGNPSGTQIVN